MKLLTRLIALLLSIALLGGVLASCGGDDEKDSESSSADETTSTPETESTTESTTESGSTPESETESGPDTEPEPDPEKGPLTILLGSINKLMSDARVEGDAASIAQLQVLGSLAVTFFGYDALNEKGVPLLTTEVYTDAGLIGLLASPMIGVVEETNIYVVHEFGADGSYIFVKEMTEEEYNSPDGLALRTKENIDIQTETVITPASDTAVANEIKGAFLKALADLCTGIAGKDYAALSAAAAGLSDLELGDYILTIGVGDPRDAGMRIDAGTVASIASVLSMLVETVNPDPNYVSESMTLEDMVVFMLAMTGTVEADSEAATAVRSFIRGELRAYFCGEEYDTLTGINTLMTSFGLTFNLFDILLFDVEKILNDPTIDGLLSKLLKDAWNPVTKKAVIIGKKLIVEDLLPVVTADEFEGFSDEQAKAIIADVVELLTIKIEATDDQKTELTDLLFSLFVKREGTVEDWTLAVSSICCCFGLDEENAEQRQTVAFVNALVAALLTNDTETLNMILDQFFPLSGEPGEVANAYMQVPFVGTATATNGANGSGNYDKTMTIANEAISARTTKSITLEAKYRPHFVELSNDPAAPNYCGYEYTAAQKDPTVEAQFQSVTTADDANVTFISLYMLNLRTGELTMNGTKVEGAQPLTLDEWNTVTLVIDLEAGTYETYVNHELYAVNGYISKNNDDQGIRGVSIDANKLFIAKCNKCPGAYLDPSLLLEEREYSYCDVDDVVLYTYVDDGSGESVLKVFAEMNFEGDVTVNTSHAYWTVETEMNEAVEEISFFPAEMITPIRDMALALAGVISAWWAKEDVEEPAKVLFGAIADAIDNNSFAILALFMGMNMDEDYADGADYDLTTYGGDDAYDGEDGYPTYGDAGNYEGDYPYEDENDYEDENPLAAIVPQVASDFFRGLANGSNVKEAFVSAISGIVYQYVEMGLSMAMFILPESVQPIVCALVYDAFLPALLNGSVDDISATLMGIAAEYNANAESELEKQLSVVIAVAAMLGMPDDTDFNELGKGITVPGMTEIDYAAVIAKIKAIDIKEAITFSEVTVDDSAEQKAATWRVSINLDLDLIKVDAALDFVVSTAKAQ